MKEEFLGLEVTDEVKICCSYCNTPLADVVITESNEDRTLRGLKPNDLILKVINCPECGKHSFPTKILSGSVSIQSCNDKFCLEDEDTSIVNKIIYSILKVTPYGK